MQLLARKGVWYARWKDAAGRDRKKSLGTRDWSEAKQLALKMELDVLEGRPLVGDESKVEWLCEWFLKRPHNLRPRSRIRQEQALKRIRQSLGSCSVTAPGFRGQVKAYQTSRVKAGAAASTVNQEVGALKQVLGEAADCFPDFVNPLLGLKRTRGPRAKRRALTTAEMTRVLSVLRTPGDRLRFTLFAFSGMRRSEGTHLRWHNVDLEAGVIRIEPDGDWQPKNGEARNIPIPKQLEAILREAPRRSLYILTTHEGKPYHRDGGNPLLWWFKRLYRRAGIKDWKDLGIHTLRHSFCSRLAQMGVRSELRAAIVGHKTLAMQNLYTHTEEDDALDAGRRLNYG